MSDASRPVEELVYIESKDDLVEKIRARIVELKQQAKSILNSAFFNLTVAGVGIPLSLTVNMGGLNLLFLCAGTIMGASGLVNLIESRNASGEAAALTTVLAQQLIQAAEKQNITPADELG